jgi:hypothetical protein
MGEKITQIYEGTPICEGQDRCRVQLEMAKSTGRRRSDWRRGENEVGPPGAMPGCCLLIRSSTARRYVRGRGLYDRAHTASVIPSRDDSTCTAHTSRS